MTTLPTVVDRRRSSPVRVFVVSFAAFLALSLCWVLATPLSGVPDEPAHVIKAAAVVRGQFSGTTVVAQGQTVQVQVPQWVADSADLLCFVGRLDYTPNCDHPPVSDSSALVSATTTAGNYNPVYYAIVGLPSLVMEGRLGLFAMRALSAALTALFVGGMFAALFQLSRRRWAVTGAIVAVTPMVLFLTGSVNPNSLEVATTGAIFANLLLVFERAGDRHGFAGRIVWVAAASALLANTKALSLLWLAIVVVAVLVLAPPSAFRPVFSRLSTWLGIAVIGIASAFALWWVVGAGSLASVPFGGAGTSFGHGAEIQINRTFEYYQALIGAFGWLDNLAPQGVLWFWGTVIGALILAALGFARARERIALIFALLALLILPVCLQAVVVHDQGFIWQGRYVLAVFIVVMLVAGVAIDRRFAPSWNPLYNRLVGILLALAIVAHVWAFVSALRRDVIGIAPDLYFIDMVVRPAWQPPSGWILLTAVYAALLAACAVTVYTVSKRGGASHSAQADASGQETSAEASAGAHSAS